MIFKYTALTAYIGVTVSLGVATFLSSSVYGSLWFFFLWGLFAVVLIVAMIMSKMWRNGGAFLLHLSFIAMLGGGLLTWLTQEKGRVKIEPREKVSTFISEEGVSFNLPYPISLEKFEILYYPGGEVPRDYVSRLRIDDGRLETVSMNRIVDLEGYRLCQASYGSDGSTVLSVNHDPYGIPLSYAGYVLFALGGGWLLVARRGRFRTLLRTLVVVPLLLASALPAAAAPQESFSKIAGVPKSTADSLRRQQVVYGGSIVTFNTLARDVVTKLYGKPRFRGLTPEQTVLSFRLFPDEWKNQPLIRIKDKILRESIGVKGEYASFSDLFDSVGNYRISVLYYNLGDRHHRAVEDLDEKAGIILTLLSGELIVAAPEDSLSDSRVNLELLYNSLPLGTMIFALLFSAFVLSAIALVVRGYGKWISMIPVGILCLALVASVANFIMQWILSDRFPVANTYETLQFVVLVLEVLSLLVARRGGMLFSLSVLGSGSLALVAHLIEMNPVVTPLMPVLHSPWLSLHVSLVMTSYALLGFTFVTSLTAMVMGDKDGKYHRLSLTLLYPGTWLLGLGIFSGAVWANVSWGQYWSWDPKETWALITLFVYALPLHRSFLRSPRAFHIYLLFAILSIAMTYFGVNYMNSLHAYGN